MRYGAYLVIAGLLIVGGPMGCAAGRTTTVRTQEHVQGAGTTVGTEAVHVDQETTTTTVTEAPRESRGVLSTTVHFLGEVISWPFRLVGALVRAIF